MATSVRKELEFILRLRDEATKKMLAFQSAVQKVQASMRAIQPVFGAVGSVLTSLGKNIVTVGRGVQEAGQRVGAFANAVGGPLKTVGLAAAVTLGFMAKSAFDMMRQVENATFILKAYTGSAKKAANITSELVAYAQSDLGILFQRGDMLDAAATLAIYGAEANKLVGYVKTLSKGVALGRTNFQELSEIVGQIIGQGKLTGIEFDLLARRGIKLDDSLRNTSISADELFKALDKAIPAGVLEGRVQSIDGRIIRLKSSFRNLGLEMLGVQTRTDKAGNTFTEFAEGGPGDLMMKFLENLRTALASPEVKKGFQELSSSIAEFSIKAMPHFIKFVEFLGRNADTIVRFLGAWTAFYIGLKSIEGVLAPLGMTIEAIGHITQGFGFFFNLIGGKYSVITRLGKAWTKLRGIFVASRAVLTATAITMGAVSIPVWAVIAAIAALAAIAVVLWKNWSTVKPFFEKLWNGVVAAFEFAVDMIRPLVETLGLIYQDLWKIIRPVFQFMGKALKAGVDTWVTSFKAIRNAVKNTLDFLRPIFQTIIGEVKKVSDDSSSNLAEMKKSWERLPQAYKEAKKGINTWANETQTKIEEWVNETKPKIEEWANNTKNTIQKWIDETKPKIKEWFNTTKGELNPWRENFLGTLQSTLDKANEKLTGYITETLGKWGGVWNQMYQKVVEFGRQLIGEITGAWNRVYGAIDNFVSQAPQRVAQAWNNIYTKVSEFVTGLPERFQGAWDGVYAKISTFVSEVPGKFQGAWDGIYQTVANFITELPNKLTNIWNTIIDSIKNSLTKLPEQTRETTNQAADNTSKNFINRLSESMKSMDKIRKIGDSIATMLLLAIAAVGIYLVDASARLVMKIVTGFNNGMGQVQEKIRNWCRQSILQPIKNFFSNAGTWLTENGRKLVDGFKNGIKEKKESITNTLSNTFATIGRFFKGVGRWLWDSGRALVSGFSSGVKSVKGWISGALSSTFAAIGRFFAGVGRWLWDSGKALVAGFVGGIKSVMGWVEEAARNIGQTAVKAAKAALQLHSPSKVFLDIGFNTGLGFMKGIESSKKMVQKVMKDTLSGGIEQFGYSPTASRQVIDNSQRSFQPQITINVQGGGNVSPSDLKYQANQAVLQQQYRALFN